MSRGKEKAIETKMATFRPKNFSAMLFCKDEKPLPYLNKVTSPLALRLKSWPSCQAV